MRRVIYVSGSRADFGLMHSTLVAIAQHPELSLSLCVTGMHLDPAYGNTVEDIENSGLNICARLPVTFDTDDGGSMAQAIATELHGMSDVFRQEQPDWVLLLGDRGEMLAAALAALHLNIPIAHIHGGERSGTVDEPVRHAISKLAHYHFTATEGARQRLIRMGEHESQVLVSGAPGLDGIEEQVDQNREALCAAEGFDSAKPLALLIFHPVVQEAQQAAEQTRILLDACRQQHLQILALAPNADTGGQAVLKVLQSQAEHGRLHLHTHFARRQYLNWLAAVDLLIGNSSSGVIEAASLGTAVVNVGKRQQARERSDNLIDTPIEALKIQQAIEQALKNKNKRWNNVYGDGRAAERIRHWLATLPLSKQLLEKTNAY